MLPRRCSKLITFGAHILSSAPVHHWPAFLTVVCLGAIQILLTYYGSRLTIDSLPMHVTAEARQRHRQVYTVMLIGFICLTLFLAKLNDSNQYRSELIVEQERAKQERLQLQLQQTLNAVLSSQDQLQQIRYAVDAHPSSAERSGMLNTIDQIQHTLQQQANAMGRTGQ